MLQFPFSTMLNSRPTMLRILLTSLALTSLALAGACASSAGTSNPRVVVMPISGSDSAEAALTQAVDHRYELVSEKRYARAAKKLDAKSQGSKDIRRVSRKLDIDAVVVGEFVKKGRKQYELRLVLRAGESGKEFDSITVKLRSKKLKKKDVRKVRKKLYSALSVVETWETSGDEDADSSSRSRGSRDSSSSSKKEMERARKIRERKQDESRKDDERRAERDEKRRRDKEDEDEKKERKRAEKDCKKAEKIARKRDRDRDDDDDRDDDEDDRSKSSKSSKKSKNPKTPRSVRKKRKKRLSKSSPSAMTADKHSTTKIRSSLQRPCGWRSPGRPHRRSLSTCSRSHRQPDTPRPSG